MYVKFVHFFYTEVYIFIEHTLSIYFTVTILVCVVESCNGSVTVYRGRLVWCVWDMTVPANVCVCKHNSVVVGRLGECVCVSVRVWHFLRDL